MPSKSTFALVALLAATSVSALPTRGSWVDLVERGPTTDTTVAAGGAVVPANGAPSAGPTPGVVPPAAVLAQTPVSAGGAPAPVAGGTGTHQHQHQHQHQHPHRRPSEPNTEASASTNGHGHGHPKRHPSHDTNGKVVSSEGTTTPHKRHRHRHHSSSGSAVTPSAKSAAVPLTPPAVGNTVPVTPPTTAPALSRREFYESLYPRDPTHPHHHRHHHHRQHAQPVDQQQAAPSPDPSSAPPLQTRELLERRGLLETLGLKARVSNLTVKQTEQMTKAKAVCGGLASKKDQHTCHKNVDKIIQLTKERNYDVEQFIKLSNHHDVFTSSDPSLKSSSTLSSTSSHF